MPVAGTTARDYLRIEDDYLIEVGLTPNRVDAASHIGVARDLAAYLRSRGERCFGEDGPTCRLSPRTTTTSA